MKRMLCAIALLLPCAAWAAPDPAQVEKQLKQFYFDAARRGDVPMLKEFAKAGYDLNTRDDKGYTSLIWLRTMAAPRRWTPCWPRAPTRAPATSAATPR